MLEKPKKPKSSRLGAFSSKSKGKEKMDENSTSENTGDENNFGYENSKSSSEEQENSENKDNRAKMMNELEKCLEAIANQSYLQKMGIVWPYLTLWDSVFYPPRFKAPTLQAFDGKGSPN